MRVVELLFTHTLLRVADIVAAKADMRWYEMIHEDDIFSCYIE